MCDHKAIVRNADMLEEMQQESMECATQALEKHSVEKNVAAHVKKELEKYSRTWHCIMRKNFGSCMMHKAKCFIYFYLGQAAILLFKSA
uniref:Dynein light chain n=1 Tax=Phascolarctos cinereus TaxID=38626 RepID=A0A6P5IM09_PHACI|nr:dynein light chain 1, cytoplasmic-like [Phascolarctos cinereus]